MGRPKKENTPERSREKATRERRNTRQESGDYRRRLSLPMSVHKWADANNLELRWANDDKNRIKQLYDQDWNFVQDLGGQIGEIDSIESMGDCYRALVGVKKTGGEMHAYLMCKPKEFFKEDYTKKQSEVDEIDAAIKGGTIGSTGKGSVENSYVPKDTPIQYKP